MWSHAALDVLFHPLTHTVYQPYGNIISEDLEILLNLNITVQYFLQGSDRKNDNQNEGDSVSDIVR